MAKGIENDANLIVAPVPHNLRIKDGVISDIIDYLVIPEDRKKEFRISVTSYIEKYNILIKKNTLHEWSHVARDFNKAHIFDTYARKAGFERGTISQGTLIASHFGEFVDGILDVFRKYDRNLFYTGQSMKFEAPIYPKKWKTAHLSLENAVLLGDKDEKGKFKTKKGIDLKISAIAPKNQVAIDNAISNLRYEREILPFDYVDNFKKDGNIVEEANNQITKEENEDYFKCLRRKEPRQAIRFPYISAIAISTLLKLASRRTGKPEGTYRKMDVQFHDEPVFFEDRESIFTTLISMPRDGREVMDEDSGKKAYVYKFKALTHQDGRIILEGKFNCVSPNRYAISD